MELNKISEPDEAELRVSTANMYRLGGINNVLDCVLTMQKCQLVILQKLNEILQEEGNNGSTEKIG